MDSQLRRELRQIIFETETRAGKIFDIGLLIIITLSIFCVIFESVDRVQSEYGAYLTRLEWFFTISFTLEYFLRIYCSKKPIQYITSFYGVIDLISIIPGYLTLFHFGEHSFLMVRGLRLFRIFRVFKLVQFVGEAHVLTSAILASRRKIAVFTGGAAIMVMIMGGVMYMVEGEENGFTNIPVSIYWSIVTMTTVGYGDLVPVTPLGKFIASVLMLLGYGMIAIPTGIVSVEIAESAKRAFNSRVCPHCSMEGHSHEAGFCHTCGGELDPLTMD